MTSKLATHIYVASQNQHKLMELQELFSLPYIVRQIPQTQPVVEDHDSYMANANAKLQAYRCKDSLDNFLLAEDSGLEVSFLNHEPGVHSARLISQRGQKNACTYIVKSLLKQEQQATARFVSLTLLRTQESEVIVSLGLCQGSITTDLSHHDFGRGFGYDSIFIPHHDTANPRQLPFSQLSRGVKNDLSHRANAVLGLLYCLSLPTQAHDQLSTRQYIDIPPRVSRLFSPILPDNSSNRYKCLTVYYKQETCYACILGNLGVKIYVCLQRHKNTEQIQWITAFLTTSQHQQLVCVE